MEFRAIKTDKLVDSAEEIATDAVIINRRLHQLTNCFLTEEQIGGRDTTPMDPCPPPIHRGDYDVSQYSKVEVQRMRKRI